MPAPRDEARISSAHPQPSMQRTCVGLSLRRSGEGRLRSHAKYWAGCRRPCSLMIWHRGVSSRPHGDCLLGLPGGTARCRPTPPCLNDDPSQGKDGEQGGDAKNRFDGARAGHADQGSTGAVQPPTWYRHEMITSFFSCLRVQAACHGRRRTRPALNRWRNCRTSTQLDSRILECPGEWTAHPIPGSLNAAPSGGPRRTADRTRNGIPLRAQQAPSVSLVSPSLCVPTGLRHRKLRRVPLAREC
jgi:hypothetical protein